MFYNNYNKPLLLKILLVEDNVLNQKVVSFNLRKFNYEVVAVTNGVDALQILSKEKFQLILMDLMLPGMNGYEITREIRKREKLAAVEKEIPIIAITANTLDNDRQKCFDAGMNEYLSKPFTVEELIHKVHLFV